MYLSRLKIRNFRCFKKLDLSLGGDTRPRMWTVLRGEAGSGKTSFLQCAALPSVTGSYVSVLDPLMAERQGARGDCSIEASYVVRASAVAGLVPDAADVLPPGQDELLLRSRMKFAVRKETKRYLSHETFTNSSTLVNPVTGDAIEVYQQGGVMSIARRPNAPPGGFWCAAYGTHRAFTRPGENFLGCCRTGDSRVTHLFRQDRQLSGLPFLNRFSRINGFELDLVDSFWNLFKTRALALVAPLFPDLPWEDEGESFRKDSPWYALPGSQESTAAWLLDLLWYATLSEDSPGKIGELSDLSGLVIVDGIDAGLSPSMQARLVPHLRQVLPKMQFLASASSPALLDTLEDDEVVGL